MTKHIIQLPFFFGVQDDKLNGGKPEKFPFTYDYNERLKLFYQISNDGLNNLLKNVYVEGSMLNGEMDFIDGGLQGKAALEFVLNNITDIRDNKVLEIGCGNGFLLKELNKRSMSCVGLEPGPQVNYLNTEFNDISIIKDFFPSPLIKEKFDIILNFNVIEHINNPIEFLLEQKKILNRNGKIIFGMPNCEPNLINGDVSIFMHEHFNYFTKDSLINLANVVDMKVSDMKLAANNGMIFCTFINKNPDEFNIETFIDSEYEWKTFNLKIDNSLLCLESELKKYKESDIAIYCPKRALNALSMLNLYNCRLIDDTEDLLNKYLPTMQNKIENFDSLIKLPPKLLIIFSRTFGMEIYNKCSKSINLRNTKIMQIENFD